MFSGIVESVATIEAIEVEKNSNNVHLILSAPFVHELTIDQSISHNGVCLTVVSISDDKKTYKVTAITETLQRSNLGELKVGDRVNVERSLRMDSRLDGHLVQGHVDCKGECTKIEDADGSTYFTIKYKMSPELIAKGYMTVEKGSVCVNGTSLTVCDSTADSFRVAIIPYTFEHTNFKDLKIGDSVNLEFDIIGKYLSKMMTYLRQ